MGIWLPIAGFYGSDRYDTLHTIVNMTFYVHDRSMNGKNNQ